MFLQTLASALQPWSDLYNGSVAVSDVVTFVHLAGIFVAGGFAVATDRAVLRAGHVDADRSYVLKELHHVHRPVIIGLILVTLTGVAMLLSDVRTFLPSLVFWVKMGLILALLLNGWVLERVGRRLLDDPWEGSGWRRLRNASLRSGGLWVLTLLFGVLLTSVG